MKRIAAHIHVAWSLLLLLALCLLPLQIRAGATNKTGKIPSVGRDGAGKAESTLDTSGSSSTSVVNSPHDLGVAGPGPINAKTQHGVCIFCHTPHGGAAQTPLWNHHSSTAKYITYSSQTMIATVGQPNGSSALCLSCHDGTVALGMVTSQYKPITMRNSVTVMPSGSDNLGTDLSQDHPISFTYNAALSATQGELVAPSALTGAVKLDLNSQMQCTTCHDPHNDQFGNFLVMDNSTSELCTTCHTNSSWWGSAHSLSAAPLKPATLSLLEAQSGSKTASKTGSKAASKTAPKTVGANACNNCHTSHKAAGRQQLLLTAQQQQTCFVCHNGTVVRQNIQAEFNKLSVHPLLQNSKPASTRQVIVRAPSQVTCSDCHDPHAVQSGTTAGPRASGPILGAVGMTRTGAIVKSLTYEYELCFRCHGDTAVHMRATVDRLVSQPNTRLAFSPSNSSYHPVVATGKNPRVPSLLSPYTVGSIINCTDCHNNDQGPGAGGTGPRGPHGSIYAPLLERQLITTDQVGESYANFALCYKCHNRDSILGDQSFRAFNSLGQDRGHRFHIVDQRTACTTCHDSHGVATSQHLINFNPDYVTAAGGRITYNSTGIFRGNCTLTCHGYTHVAAAYPSLMIHPSPAIKTSQRPAPGALIEPNLRR